MRRLRSVSRRKRRNSLRSDSLRFCSPGSSSPLFASKLRPERALFRNPFVDVVPESVRGRCSGVRSWALFRGPFVDVVPKSVRGRCSGVRSWALFRGPFVDVVPRSVRGRCSGVRSWALFRSLFVGVVPGFVREYCLPVVRSARPENAG